LSYAFGILFLITCAHAGSFLGDYDVHTSHSSLVQFRQQNNIARYFIHVSSNQWQTTKYEQKARKRTRLKDREWCLSHASESNFAIMSPWPWLPEPKRWTFHPLASWATCANLPQNWFVCFQKIWRWQVW